MNRIRPHGLCHVHLLRQKRLVPKHRFAAHVARAALLLALSLPAIGLCDLGASHAQLAPPILTDPIGAPLSGPQPPQFLPESASPIATPTPSAPPLLLPTATATPSAEPEETPIAQTPLAYRIQGNLALTTQSQDSFPVTQNRGFEVIVVPPAPGENTTTIRRLRLWPADESTDVHAVTAYERDNTAMAAIGDDSWSIHARNRQSPLARALRPVLDAGALAYEICVGGSSGARSVDGDAVDACTLEDAADVAEFLSGQNPGLRVETSTLVAELDRVAQRVQRLVLAAEVTSVLDASTSYRIEWSYTVDALDGGSEIASRGFEWSAVGPRMEEGDMPGFSAGSLPSPERIVGIEKSNDVVHILYALSQAETRETVRTALRKGGWNVQDSGSFLIARQADQVVVVFADIRGDTTTVDIVGMR